MSGTAVALIVAVLVALAALVLFTTARRRDPASLTRDTLKRDKSDSPSLPGQAQPTGRDVEREAVLARRTPGTEIEKAGDRTPAPYVPPDPEVVGVTRRQFFNR